MHKSSHSDNKSCDHRPAHGVVRALLSFDEKRRLYPDGHGQVRKSLKSVLLQLQAYAEMVGRNFAFVPELAADVEGSAVLRKDFANLARRCREKMIQKLEIDAQVDYESIEWFSDFLATENPCAAPPDSISIEFFADADVESYFFAADGSQLFAAASSARAKQLGRKTDDRNLTRLFENEGVRDRLANLSNKISSSGATEREDAVEIDLIGELSAVLAPRAQSVSTSPEELANQLTHLLGTLEELFSLDDDSATRTLTEAEIREVIRSSLEFTPRDGESDSAPSASESTGVSTEQSGEPAVTAASNGPKLSDLEMPFFEESLTVQANTTVPETAAAEDVTEDSFSLDDVDILFDTPAISPATQDVLATLREDSAVLDNRQALEDSAILPDLDLSEESTLEPNELRVEKADSILPEDLCSPGLDALLDVQVDRRAISRHVQSFDYDLERLRVLTEMMAQADAGEQYEKVRDGFVRSFNSHAWPTPTDYLTELGDSVRILEDARQLRGVDLLQETLSGQDDQDVVDQFFEEQAREGIPMKELRPVLERLADEDPARPLRSLDKAWRVSDRQLRPACVDEIYNLAPPPDELAHWGQRNPQAFSSSRGQDLLAQLSSRDLGKIFENVYSASSESKGLSPTVLATLKALATKPDAESHLVVALTEGGPRLRRETLKLITRCHSNQLFSALERIVDDQNASKDPDLEEVHAALSALVKSPLRRAHAYLDGIREERKLLRHSYRREIRDILSLLEQIGETV